MKNIMTVAAFALGALVAFAAASPQNAKEAPPHHRTVMVTFGDDMRFSPPKIVIDGGGSVLWRNLSHEIHNVVDTPGRSPRPGVMALPDGAEPFDSGFIDGGESFARTFTVPGTYKYVCTLHIANRMVGEIVVR